MQNKSKKQYLCGIAFFLHFDRQILIFFSMLKDYLDVETYAMLAKSFDFNSITEIRMRLNQKLIVCIKSKKYYLKNDKQQYVIVTNEMLQNFIRRISENSLYAYNESLIQGYITLPKGVRVGICGSYVFDQDKLVTIKDFQAVNIRIPHQIKNCSLNAYLFLVDGGEIKSTLIISPPGAGKTTFLRDFVYQLGQHNISKNILIVDERNEICSCVDGKPELDLGGFCDVIANCNKRLAFKNGIRSMAPDVIVTDELDLENDLESVKLALNCGVKVVATIHAKDVNELRRKAGFEKLLEEKYFSRFVVLGFENGPGSLQTIYNEKLNCLYCGEAWNGCWLLCWLLWLCWLHIH